LNESHPEIPIIPNEIEEKYEKLNIQRNIHLGGKKEKEKIIIQERNEESRDSNSDDQQEIQSKDKRPLLRRSSRTILGRDDPNYFSKNRSELKKADDAISSRPLMQDRIDPDALMVHCFNVVDKTEPHSFEEAMKRDDAEGWKKSIEIENQNLKDNETWVEVKPWQIPKDSLIVGSRWVFKYKTDSNNNVFHKARLVAKGYTQIPGIHYDEVSSPVGRYATARAIKGCFKEL